MFTIRGMQTSEGIPVEDTISVVFRFKRGGTGQGVFTWGAKASGPVLRYTVFAAGGTLEVDYLTSELTLNKGGGRTTWVEPWDGPQHGHWEIRHFAECVARDEKLVADAAEEIKTLKVALAAYQSVKKNSPVYVDELESSQAEA